MTDLDSLEDAAVTSICFEGLPGAGKTTLIEALAARVPACRVVPETVIRLPHVPSLDDFVRNDLRKEELLRHENGLVLVDRYWPSTVVYHQAEQRLLGRRPTLREVQHDLFGRALFDPDVYVLLDSRACVRRSTAVDGLWPDAAFRSLVREGYRQFAESRRIVVTINVDKLADRPEQLAMRLLRKFISPEYTRKTSGSCNSTNLRLD
jgi:thymidylate kinase